MTTVYVQICTQLSTNGGAVVGAPVMLDPSTGNLNPTNPPSSNPGINAAQCDVNYQQLIPVVLENLTTSTSSLDSFDSATASLFFSFALVSTLTFYLTVWGAGQIYKIVKGA